MYRNATEGKHTNNVCTPVSPEDNQGEIIRILEGKGFLTFWEKTYTVRFPDI